jgi:hypothetical protein
MGQWQQRIGYLEICVNLDSKGFKAGGKGRLRFRRTMQTYGVRDSILKKLRNTTITDDFTRKISRIMQPYVP